MSENSNLAPNPEPGRYPFALRLSDLALLRRTMERYPLKPEERRMVMEQIRDMIVNATSERARQSAIRTLAMMEGINQREVELAIKMVEATNGPSEKEKEKEKTPTSISVNVEVNNSLDQALENYDAAIASRLRRMEIAGPDAQSDGVEQPVHPALPPPPETS